MSRIQSLVSSPKRTLAALATVLVAVGITTASGANFTAQSANAGNAFAAGTMTIGNSNDTGTTAILSASNMKPLDTTTSTVDIENTGSLAGAFTLKKGTLTDPDSANKLSTVLDLTIKDCGAWTGAPLVAPSCVGGTQVYNDTIANMNSAPAYGLGGFAAGERHRYQFTVALQDVGNNFQGKTSTVEFIWNAS